jgi:transcription-repair coupling factor (superfamily II helicase)
MYTELLERAVNALKQGKDPKLDKPLNHGAEIDLHVPALIPNDYIPDVHERLIMYKRIASAANKNELKELQVEMIDRFGLLPDAVKALHQVTELKLKASQLGIKKIDYGEEGGRIVFVEQPDIDPMKIIQLIQSQPNTYKLDGNDKIRLLKPIVDTEHRIKALEELFNYLS